MICPRCNTKLNKTFFEFGLFYACRSCNGRAVSLSVVRKAVPQFVIKDLWKKSLALLENFGSKCPVCDRKTGLVTISVNDRDEHLDVCNKCQFIWFDPQEFENLPKIEIKKSFELEIPIELRQKLAIEKINALREERELMSSGISSPDYWWEYILGIMGMPVEYNNSRIYDAPIGTYMVAFLMVLISLAAFFSPETAIMNWGLIPNQFERFLGFTFVSSFFLHGDVLHLLGNLYFFLIFGDNVEDLLGIKQYILLIILAAFSGDLLHILSNVDSSAPLIGASGGISGVLTYYCLSFPKARVGVLWLFRWFRIPVGLLLFIWILLQLTGALYQISGLSDVSAFAHLGGCFAGILYWLFRDKSYSSSSKRPPCLFQPTQKSQAAD